jgi:DNA-directed RNA polymerase specialized sigma24 family protein
MVLKELPLPYFEVITLKEYGEFNYREIGRILGISEGAVKIRMFRACRHLSAIIKKYPFSEFFTDSNRGYCSFEHLYSRRNEA